MKKPVGVLLLFWMQFSQGQDKDSTWSVVPAVGFSLRSPVMYFFNFDYPEPYSNTIQDYNDERNLQGISFQPSILFTPSYSKWSFRLIPSIRYDDTYLKIVRVDTVIGSQGLWLKYTDKQVKEFIFEPQIAVFRQITKKTNLGLGFGVVNTGKKFTTIEGWKNDLQFYTLDLIFQRQRRHITWEIQAHYIKGDFPRDPYQDFIMYSASVAWFFFPNSEKN